MLRSFPPFPSPNPASMDHPPLGDAPIVPSPPSSESSSVLSPQSTPATPYSPPYSPSSPTNADGRTVRSRSRSAARRCAPPHTRIAKRDTRAPSVPQTPPATPPADGEKKDAAAKTVAPPEEQEEEEVEDEKEVQEQNNSEVEIARKRSVRTHRYEDAVRIACGAWAETAPKQKKKSVTWDEDLPA
ncbi:hypothetical protein TWF696_002521 [Orbilia brochopaga]|uniref:Uncharacterized protein n=1 Tax=Orbilia brochopaga TaxID=3140254 RepID=A0AAV9U4U6_9PEZI